MYIPRRLIGSRVIESTAYCNQISLVPLYLNSTQNTSVNWIIRLLLSLLCWPKVILLSGGHCITKLWIWFFFPLQQSLLNKKIDPGFVLFRHLVHSSVQGSAKTGSSRLRCSLQSETLNLKISPWAAFNRRHMSWLLVPFGGASFSCSVFWLEKMTPGRTWFGW